MLLFFEAIMWGAVIGVICGLCSIVHSIWALIRGDDDGQKDELKSPLGLPRFSRITVHPDQMGGVPCVRELRIPAATAVDLLAQGMTEEEVLAEHPDLELEDLREVLRFAAVAVDERQLPLAASG